MKKLILFILLISILIPVINAQEQLQLVKPTLLKWTGKNAVTGQQLSGTLMFNSGSITLNEDQIVSGKLEVNMLSLKADNEELEEHLRAEDFFNVDKFKTATFILNNYIQINSETKVINGEMTIVGITKEVSPKLQISGIQDQVSVKGTIAIDRTMFGIYYDSPSFFTRMKEKAIEHEFIIEFEVFFE